MKLNRKKYVYISALILLLSYACKKSYDLVAEKISLHEKKNDTLKQNKIKTKK